MPSQRPYSSKAEVYDIKETEPEVGVLRRSWLETSAGSKTECIQAAAK